MTPNLHATTWWTVALVVAFFATLSTNPILLTALIVTCLVTMLLFRDQTLRSRSVVFYIAIALAVILIRIAFRIIFNQPDSFQVTALDLPLISFGDVMTFLGPVSWQALKSALTDGLRLAAIILAIGMANTVANPRKLLRSTPGALYEIATAAAVAINLAPQLVESLHRVRKARSLRSSERGFKAFKTIVIPVLEDALDRSLSLAASMDARGFGRQENVTKTRTATIRAMSIVAILLIAIGAFWLLVSTSQAIALALLIVGVTLLFISFKLQSLRSLRTFYRPEKPRLRDVVTVFCVLGALLGLSAL
jgi:energy-coupling factor transport system permease protein